MKDTTLKHLTAFLKELRALNPEMNVTMALTFLEVAKGNGVTGRDIEEALDLNHTTAARMLKYFDKIQREGRAGFDMFEARLDPVDYRAKRRFLNKNGEAFLRRLAIAAGEG